MGLNSILNSASTSLAAQRVAIDVTGQNIANVNTPGYSRQRVMMETGSTTTLNGFPLGNGVHIATVQRIYDNVVLKQIADSNSSLGNSESKMQGLQQLEPYFNELTGNSLGDAIQKFSDSWQALSLNPSGVAERQSVLGRASILVDTFHQLNEGIRNVQTFANESIAATATGITSAAKEIASLNNQIKQTEMVGANANEMRDNRDYLLQQLSKQVGITTVSEADGTITVTLAGGEALVSGNQYARLYGNSVATTDPNLPNPSNDLLITAVGNPPPTVSPGADTNVTATIGAANNSQGEIGGLLYIRDTAMTGYLAKLDEMAYNLAYQVNSQHSAGYTLTGATSVQFFTPATTTAPPAMPADYKGYSSSSTGIAIAISNTNDIAAADASGGTSNNKNALFMAEVFSQQVTFSGGVQSTVKSYYTSTVSMIGVDVQGATNQTTQNESFLKQLGNLRESIAGVSLDEELTNLIKYQKAYEGASKIILTATQMMDTVLGLIR